MINIIARAAWAFLLASGSVLGTSAQSNTNVSGSSSANGVCGAATVGNDVINDQICVVIVENNKSSRPAAIRLSDSQMERLSGMVAAKLFQMLADLDREYANGSLLLEVALPPPTNKLLNVSAVSPVGGELFQPPSHPLWESSMAISTFLNPGSSPFSSSMSSMRLDDGAPDAIQTSTSSVLWNGPRLLNNFPNANSLNSTPLFRDPPASDAQYPFGAGPAITGMQTLIRIDMGGPKSTVLGILGQGNDATLGVPSNMPAGILKVGADGSLELSGAQGIPLGFQASATPTLELPSPAMTGSLGSVNEEFKPSLYVGAGGTVKLDGVPLTVGLAQPVNSFPSNGIGSDVITASVPAFPVAEYNHVLPSNMEALTPPASCNSGGVLSVSANGNISPCALAPALTGAAPIANP